MLALWSLLFCSACHDTKHGNADRLNETAYSYHYRSLDSVKHYADSVMHNPSFDSDAKAEALNNLAFYHTAKMEYDIADSLLHEIGSITDNQIELMIASVQQMRLCQRHSDNKSFYEYRQQALQHQARIYEDMVPATLSKSARSARLQKENIFNAILHGNDNTLTPHQTQRLHYAESEFDIVSSAYYYYVGLIPEAQKAIEAFNTEITHAQDTSQYLAYLYNIGAGGLLTQGSQAEIAQQEFEMLLKCYQLATQYESPFWVANAMQALSEHLQTPKTGKQLIEDNESAIDYINVENVADTLLAGNLAERSLHLFEDYGDLYQIAAAWRSLSECYFGISDYGGTIYCLQKGLEVSSKVKQAPSLLASIHEKLSIAYSAINDKPQSDYHRNLYLELQENTRQDRELEARTELLSSSLKTMDIMIYSIIALISILITVLIVLILKRRHDKKSGEGNKNKALVQFREFHDSQIEKIEEEEEEIDESIAVARLNLDRQRENYEEHRAKMSLIDSLTPLIDRMLHEIECLQKREESKERRNERLAYISELTQQINKSNDVLTDWIRMKQGDISLRIETFEINDILDMVAKGATAFRRQGIKLITSPTNLTAKADRTLTLFMVNTLCDNARKFTPAGGYVTITASEVSDDMVEIAVEDSGSGMSSEQIATLFDAKSIKDDGGAKSGAGSHSHGFALLNCKGIIEKYKKTSPLFHKCRIAAESEIGKGTRIAFRLPKGIKRVMGIIALILPTFVSNVSAQTEYADSIYFSNIDGNYEQAMRHAEKCINDLNTRYREISHGKSDTLSIHDSVSAIAPEIRWYRDSLDMPYDVILTLRNEVAVAALALHDYVTYNYNNDAYSYLFREMSVDKSLVNYYKQMQQTESNRTIAIALLIFLVLAFIPVYYFLYYRHVITDTRDAIQSLQDDIDQQQRLLLQKQEEKQRLDFENDRLHVANNVMSNSLSTIKHETMYFPSRIKQLVDSGEIGNDLSEVANYYRSLYEILSRQARYNCRQQLTVIVLIDILEQKLARLAGIRRNELKKSIDGAFCIYKIVITKPDIATERLVTQIARDLGEITNQRRCGTLRSEQELSVCVPDTSKGHP